MNDRRPSATPSGNPPAAESGATIQVGEALWRARQRMRLSVEEVACLSGVAPRLIRAIEDSMFDRLPSHDETIAAAQAYARVVDLPTKWVALTLSRIFLDRQGPAGD
jgi:transcriptional regulator with XRE-family HTH domain